MASQGGAINFAAAAKSDSRDSPLKEVQVDGSVLLKIQKHCKDAQPNLVTGLMLGLDVGVRLEVTSCVPHASGDDDGDDDAYQLEMMRCLRELNVDNNIVGWYQSATLGSYHTVELIDTFISYWDSIKRAVCIVYDPQRSGNGGIAIKAVKVADTFISIYQTAMKAGAPLTAEKLRGSGVSWHDVFQELPVKVSNGTLTCALMAELEPEAPATQCDFDRLSLSVAPTLEGNLLLLNGCIDDIVAEQGKVSEYHNKLRRQQQQQQQWLQKRKQENMQRKAAGEEPLPEEDPVLFKPFMEHSQLVTYLLSNQRAWIALEHKGIEYEYREQDSYDKTAEFLAASPRGMVPALTLPEAKRSIYESGILLQFIDEYWESQGPSMMPTAALDRAAARLWMDRIDAELAQNYYACLGARMPTQRKAAIRRIHQLLEDWSAAAQETPGPFFFGGGVSVVDISIAPWVWRLRTMLAHRCRFSFPDTPASSWLLQEWWPAMQQLPAYQATVCDDQKLIQNGI